MGSIMCLGVSVSNSVMLVTFMDEHWKGGSPSTEAAILGAGDRLRPILMTACAMTVGMVPMALALEQGSQMQAPLGRAVIGGLVMSTFATLLVLPSIFAIVIGRKVARSPSIYPDDPESTYYDPRVFVDEEPARPSTSPAGHVHDDVRRARDRRAAAKTTRSWASSGGSSTRPDRSGMTWSRITPSTTSGSPSASPSPGPTRRARPARAGTPRPNHSTVETGQAAEGGHAPGSDPTAPSNARPLTRGPLMRRALPVAGGP